MADPSSAGTQSKLRQGYVGQGRQDGFKQKSAKVRQLLASEFQLLNSAYLSSIIGFGYLLFVICLRRVARQ
jgi:hypothetical protein